MSLWERLTGKVVDVATLGQKKRAVATGIMAFDGPLGDLRLDIAIKSHPWLQNSATMSFLLSAWAAQALQDMAALLETAAQEHLGEQGKLPEATFLFAERLYGEALEWIEQAQRALAAIDVNPEYKLFRPLPAAAPRMDWIADAPPTHFVAAIRSAVQLGTSAEDALNTAQNDRSRLQRSYDGAFETIEAAVRMARAKLDQVQAAESDRQAVRLSREIWSMLTEVVRIYFLAGQQAAMPALIDPRYDAAARASARAARLPPPPATRQPAPGTAGQGAAGAAQSGGYAPRTMGQPATPQPPPPPPPPEPTLGERLGLRFDAWALTDHGAKATYQHDRTRIAELEAFWRADPNPDETYRLFGLITSAVKAGTIAARPGEFSRACPWISTFAALADVSVGTERFATGQLFTLKVGKDGDYFGRGFERQGFLPGTQQPKPRPAPSPEPDTGARGPAAAADSSPRIDTQHHAQRTPEQTRQGATRTPPAPPGPPAPDIWLLTAAFERPQRRANPADADKVKRLWQADPDPAATVRFHDELMAAVSAGDVRQQGDEALRDCPWSQVYVAVKPVAVGGVRLERNEKFALDVGMAGGTFRRRIARLGLISTRA